MKTSTRFQQGSKEKLRIRTKPASGVKGGQDAYLERKQKKKAETMEKLKLNCFFISEVYSKSFLRLLCVY